MDSSQGEMEGNTEELTGRKKSRFKVLKTRLFGRLKKKETEAGQMKQSKSTSDVTAHAGKRGEEELEDDCGYPQGTLSSRALSHDSIFLADPPQSSTEPTRVLSQENVHSKIKALQVKLQQQNIRLGPPPLLIPGKRIEDSGTTSEDDGLPCSPPEMSFQEVAISQKHPEAKKHLSLISLSGTGSEEEDQGGSSQPPSRPLSPVPRFTSSQTGTSSPTDLLSPPAGTDFCSPAHQVTCLDNSAARHRMSVKPRNQRASTKGRKQSVDVYRSRSNSINNLDQPLPEREEAPEDVTSVERVQHQTCNNSSQVINLEQGPSSPVPVSAPPIVTLQDQQEITALDVGPLSTGDEVLKSGEPLQPDDLGEGVKKETADILADTNEEPRKQPKTSLQTQVTSPVLNIVTECSESTAHRSHTTDQMEMLKKDAEPLARPHPVPAPRTKKPTVDSRHSMPLKTSSPRPTEVEKETVLHETSCRNPPPSEGLDASPKEDDNKAQRPNSFRFSIASAKYRSKTISIENLPKQDEDGSSNSQNVELPTEKVKEVYKSGEGLSTLEKRTSLQKELIPQNVSKTDRVGGVKAEKSEGLSPITFHEKGENAEESEQRKGLFGIKLRSTSLSLKYRSDVAKSEDKAKRHSLEAHHLLAVSEDHAGKEPAPRDTEEVNKERKPSVPTNVTPQNSDLQQDPTGDRGSDKDINSGSEPAWMSLVREKTRAHQPSSSKPSTQPDPSPQNSTSSSAPLTSSVQQPTKPTPQPRPHLRTTKSQLRTCFSMELQPDSPSSQQTPPKPAPRALNERRALANQGGEKSSGSQSPSGAEIVDSKGPPKPGVRSNMQTDPDVHRRTPAIVPTNKAEPSPSSAAAVAAASSLSHQQSSSERNQPSWMELAKRKSLAWSDMSLD